MPALNCCMLVFCASCALAPAQLSLEFVFQDQPPSARAQHALFSILAILPHRTSASDCKYGH